MAGGVRIQPRDVEILISLGTARYLTVQALEWLHVPTWRARWTRYQQEKREYHPIGNLYRRLEAMRDAGYVTRITRTAERAITTFRRLPDVYTLTPAGADLTTRTDLVTDGGKARSLTNLEHTATTALLYAALRAELESQTTGLYLDGWRDDRQLAASADRITLAGQMESRALIPDATFVLRYGSRQRRYFVETDMGTRSLDTWRVKARSYAAYFGSNALSRRYSVADFILLITAPTQRRVDRISAIVAEADEQLASVSRYIVHEAIQPTTIQTWQQITSTERHERARFGRPTVDIRTHLAPMLLWK